MTKPRVLIVFHTVEGQTRKIADRVADSLRRSGMDVAEHPTGSAPAPDGYDGVVVGDSIHAAHHSKQLERYLVDYAPQLKELPTGMFQVCLTSANPDDEHTATAQGLAQEMLDRTGFNPRVVGLFAGRLAYTEYGWLKRQLLRIIVRREGVGTDTSRDYEYTDWDAVEQFAGDFSALVRSTTGSGAQRSS